jgi:hypothetical protein
MEKATYKTGFIESIQDVVALIEQAEVANLSALLGASIKTYGVAITSYDTSGAPYSDLQVVDVGPWSSYTLRPGYALTQNGNVICVPSGGIPGNSYPVVDGTWIIALRYKVYNNPAEDVTYDETYSPDGHTYNHNSYEIVVAASFGPSDTDVIQLAEVHVTGGVPDALTDVRYRNVLVFKEGTARGLFKPPKPLHVSVPETGLDRDLPPDKLDQPGTNRNVGPHAYLRVVWGDKGVGNWSGNTFTVTTSRCGSYNSNEWAASGQADAWYLYDISAKTYFKIISNGASAVTVEGTGGTGSGPFLILPKDCQMKVYVTPYTRLGVVTVDELTEVFENPSFVSVPSPEMPVNGYPPSQTVIVANERYIRGLLTGTKYRVYVIATKFNVSSDISTVVDKTTASDGPPLPKGLVITTGIDEDQKQPEIEFPMCSQSRQIPKTAWIKLKWGDTGSGSWALNVLTDVGKSWLSGYWIGQLITDSIGKRQSLVDSGVSTLVVPSGSTGADGSYAVGPGALGYEVQLQPMSSGGVSGVDEEEELFRIDPAGDPADAAKWTPMYYTKHGLTVGVKYRARVRSSNGPSPAQKSAWSSWFPIIAGARTRLPAPTGGYMIKRVGGVDLSWNGVVNAKGYEIAWTKDGSTPDYNSANSFILHTIGTRVWLGADLAQISGVSPIPPTFKAIIRAFDTGGQAGDATAVITLQADPLTMDHVADGAIYTKLKAEVVASLETTQVAAAEVVSARGTFSSIGERLSAAAAQGGFAPGFTRIVAKEGAQFSDPQAAINDIKSAGIPASRDNPYVVIVYPGIYQTNLLLENLDGIYVVGLDPKTTVIKGDITVLRTACLPSGQVYTPEVGLMNLQVYNINSSYGLDYEVSYQEGSIYPTKQSLYIRNVDVYQTDSVYEAMLVYCSGGTAGIPEILADIDAGYLRLYPYNNNPLRIIYFPDATAPNKFWWYNCEFDPVLLSDTGSWDGIVWDALTDIDLGANAYEKQWFYRSKIRCYPPGAYGPSYPFRNLGAATQWVRVTQCVFEKTNYYDGLFAFSGGSTIITLPGSVALTMAT